MYRKFSFFLPVVFLCTTGCYKYEQHSGNVDRPGVAITFDDRNIDNWYKYLPLLDSFGAKVTFYISGYHLLTPEQKNKLKEMKMHGHEIAYHTTFHSNLCDFLRFQGLDRLMQIEIYQDLKKMKKDGFYPQTFAYPYGAHDYYLDKQLLTIFKSVRASNGTKNLAKSVTRTTSNTLLYGLSMDNDKHNNSTMEEMINLANKNHNCVVMVGHQIENPDSKLQVPYQKLKFILQKVKSLNMKFYTVSEISN